KLNSTITDQTGGQILEFSVKKSDISANDPAFSLSSSLLDLDGYFDGCVITMTSGPAAGKSSRIVRYDATPSNPVFHVLAFNGVTSLTDANNPNPKFIINGRAFSGTGFGFRTATDLLDAKDGNSHEFALLPNPAAYTPTGEYSGNTPFGGIGGCNTG